MNTLEKYIKNDTAFAIVGTNEQMKKAEPILKKLGIDTKIEEAWNCTRRHDDYFGCIVVYPEIGHIFIQENALLRNVRISFSDFMKQAKQILNPDKSHNKTNK